MTSYELDLLQRHANSGVLIDTNILILLVLGSYDKKQIEVFKRTRVFVVEDYDTLVSFVGHFAQIITTPNIITEASNILGQLPENIKFGAFNKLKDLIYILKEEYVTSKNASSSPEFIRFGVTDATILAVSQVPYLVLTDDFRLSQYLQSKGVDVINFNHIRTFNWS